MEEMNLVAALLVDQGPDPAAGLSTGWFVLGDDRAELCWRVNADDEKRRLISKTTFSGPKHAVIEQAKVFMRGIGAHRCAPSIYQLQHEIGEWRRRNFPKYGSIPTPQMAGVAEEYFELGCAIGPVVRAALKGDQGVRVETFDRAKVKDAVADLFIFLNSFCDAAGINMEEALMETWDEVRERDWVAYRAEHGSSEQ